MTIYVVRYDADAHRTIGKLSINGVWYCYTLEDAVRAEKIPGVTAIPYGTYRVILNESQRFKRVMPLLLDVPNFTGVRIHSGNTATDTEGCLLVGMTRSIDAVHDSRRAFESLMARLEAAVAGRELITITISRAAPPLVA